MPYSQSFRDLKVWKKSMDLVEQIYVASKRFPADERFGLTAQIRRAVVSVPSNIGEGSRRKKRNVFLNHLDIALGSQAEVEVQLEIAYQLKFLPALEYKRTQTAVEEIGRMLNGLIMSLQPAGEEENS
jgi:four helix bundle protein